MKGLNKVDKIYINLMFVIICKFNIKTSYLHPRNSAIVLARDNAQAGISLTVAYKTYLFICFYNNILGFLIMS